MSEERSCPYCDCFIRPDFKFCPHCLKELPPDIFDITDQSAYNNVEQVEDYKIDDASEEIQLADVQKAIKSIAKSIADYQPSKKEKSIAKLKVLGFIGICILASVVLIVLGILRLGSSVGSKLSTSGSSPPNFSLDPLVTPNPGWKKFEGGNVEIWLPGSYIGGDLDKDLPLIADGLRELGSDYESMFQMIEENRDAFLIYAYDSIIRPTGSVHVVNMVHEQIFSTVKLDDYIDLCINQLPEYHDLVSKEYLYFGNRRVGRYISEFNINGVVGGITITYVIKSDSHIWGINFVVSVNEFDLMLRISEDVIRTFRVSP